MKLIDGKVVSNFLQEQIALQVNNLVESGKKIPHLAAVLVGNDPASETYIASKVKACEKVGFRSSLKRLDNSITQEELLKVISELNGDKDVDGFIVQLPLPKHIDEQKVIEAIAPSKDVDGFHPVNVGRMALNLPSYLPATPYGVMQLLDYYKIETTGKHCVVLGRSHIVGSPMSILMARNSNPGNCTVTICHSKTKDLKEFTLKADILIVAIGKPDFVKADMVKEGCVVIDVGIHRVDDSSVAKGYRITGDVDFKEVSKKASAITPVPGGVGPMTIACLLQNTLVAATQGIY